MMWSWHWQLHEWDLCLCMRSQRAPWTLPPCEDTERKCHPWTRKQALSLDPGSTGILILDFVLRTVKNYFLFFKPLSVWYFLWQPEWTSNYGKKCWTTNDIRHIPFVHKEHTQLTSEWISRSTSRTYLQKRRDYCWPLT